MKGVVDPSRVIERLESLRETALRSEDAEARGRAAFLEEARALREASFIGADAPAGRRRGRGRTWQMPLLAWTNALGRPLIVAFALAILLLGGVAATANAAQGAIPGNTLYPVKTGLERAQLALTRDQAAEARLHLSFAERRLTELSALVEGRRFDRLPGVASAFEAHLKAAMQDLSSIAEIDPHEARQLSSAVNESMTRFVAILSRLALDVPAKEKGALEGALESSRQPVEFEVAGVVSSINPAGWEIQRTDGTGILRVRVSQDSEVDAGIVIGDRVNIRAISAADGSVLAMTIERIDEMVPEATAPATQEPPPEQEDIHESPGSSDDGSDGAEGEEEIETDGEGHDEGEKEGHDEDEKPDEGGDEHDHDGAGEE